MRKAIRWLFWFSVSALLVLGLAIRYGVVNVANAAAGWINRKFDEMSRDLW